MASSSYAVFDDLPHSGQHLNDDITCTDDGGSSTQYETSSFILDFDFIIFCSDCLMVADDVVVIEITPLGYSRTLAFCMKYTPLCFA